MMKDNPDKRKMSMAFRCLYGFGVLFILLSHCDGGGLEFLNNWVNFGAFHVAIFLFGSGYFFKDEDLDKPGKWFAKKLCKLILPLFVWNIIYGVIVLILKQFGFFTDVKTDLVYFVFGPVISDRLFLFNLASWFVFPFFAVQVIWFVCTFIGKRIGTGDEKDRPARRHIVLSFVFIIIGIAGVLLCNAGYRTDVLIPIFRIMYFCPFYGAGYLLSLVDITKHRKAAVFAFVPALVISLMLNTYFGRSVYVIPSSCDYPFGLAATYLSAFCGIALWLSISFMICGEGDKESVLCKPFVFLADNGFFIMMHQFMGFFLLKSVFAIFNGVAGLFGDFDMTAFKTDIWYMYLPKEINEYKFLYVLAGISFSYLISFIEKRILRRSEK